MRKLACLLGVCALFATVASAGEIAYWNFNDTTNLGGSSGDLWRVNPWGTVDNKLEYQKDYPKWPSPAAEISVWGSDTSEGNYVGTNGGTASNNFGSFTGTNLNAQHGDIAGSSFSPVGTANNGSYFLIEFDGAYPSVILSYDTRGTGTGYTTHQIDYSTDNGLTWTPKTTFTGRNVTTFSTLSVDFLNVFANTSGHESNMIRLTVSGCTSASGNNRFDNILLTPEPASVLLLGLASLFLRRR